MKKKSIKTGYLEKVKPIQNRVWTDKEKAIIYTLRESKVPSPEIAQKLKCNITQVYNITRLMRSGAKHKCFCCGRKLTAIEMLQKNFVKACNKCKKAFTKYKKERRLEAIEKGICCYCNKRKATPGYVSCPKCVSATHRRRVAEGLCGQCGERPPHKDGATLCEICLRKNEARIKLKRG